MQDSKPFKPSDPDPLAVELLTGLSRFPAARNLVLGGYFALKHYCDYRTTHDVDAWWPEDSSSQEREEARAALRTVLEEIGQRQGLHLRERRFGDTESWELLREARRIFSFQIADRTLQLAPYLPSPWPPLQIESLTDNIGSKMNALLQRGAPRDLVDIREVIRAELATPAECWDLWQRKNPDLPVELARAEAARRLQELELRRPLETIADPADRERAREIRAWFWEKFLKPHEPGS